MGAERAPGWARVFGTAFVAVFAVCAVLGLEWWPFTGWKLFSQLRVDQQVAYEARYSADGEELPVPWERMGEHRGFIFIMRDFAAGERQEGACAAWLDGLERHVGARRPRITIYRHRWRLSDRDGDRARRPAPEPAWRCDRSGVRELDS
jgi:hypothetical protein